MDGKLMKVVFVWLLLVCLLDTGSSTLSKSDRRKKKKKEEVGLFIDFTFS